MWNRHKVSVLEANEAVRDIDGLWFDPDPRSRSGRGVRVIGYSHSRRAVITVIVVRRSAGSFYGANGWESNSSDRSRYERGE
ncbi:MAG: transposase [Rhodococcus sp.]|nr:transposase [Rhodococcus sp. (in: high G+C Gram-positive bacteria)]